MSANLQQILAQVRALPPSEIYKLRLAIDETPPQMTEEEFESYLLAKGVIGAIPTRPDAYTAHQDFRPIEILDGKPVSETIIEERR